MKYLTIIKLVVSLLPVLIEAIKAVEAAIPGRDKGEIKLAAVRGVLEGVYGTATDLGVTFAEAWPAIAKAAAALVLAFNTVGEFQK